MIETNANQWQSAEQEVEARLVEYEKGLTPVNVVLQSQQRRAEAQIGYYRAVVEYNKSLNYVDYIKGTLLPNSGITLREGPWNTKAYCDALERARERSAGYHLEYGVTRPSVVRTGPVMKGPASGQISDVHGVGSGVHAPPQEIILNGPDQLGAPTPTEPIPFEIQPSVPDMDGFDQPLSELGSPAEMFNSPSPEPMPRAIPDPNVNTPSSVLPTPTPPENVPAPLPESGQVESTSYQQERTRQGAPAPVSRRPLPSARYP